MTTRLRSEAGVTLIHVAISLLVLMGLSSFVLDYGVVWLARGQAQNAADAGALAGAIARAFDDFDNPPEADGKAAVAARETALLNPTVGDGTFGDPVVTWECPASAIGGVAGTGCVQVDVHRDGSNNSTPLDTFFLKMFNVESLNVRATATAQASVANAVDCLRPFAVPDLFTNNRAPDEEYNHYKTNNPGKGDVLPDFDVYTAPTATDPGTGYTVARDYGTRVTLKLGNPSGSNPPTPGWFMPIDVPRADGTSAQGGARYRANIASCNATTVDLGDYLNTENGVMIGPTDQGFRALYDQDPGADWDEDEEVIVGSCAPACGPFSPRIIALAVFDTELFHYSSTRPGGGNGFAYCPGGGTCVKIVNFIGFFVDEITPGGDIIGYLVRYPGVLSSTPNPNAAIGPQSAFTTVITLVR